MVTDDYMSMIMDGTFHVVDGDDDEHHDEKKHSYRSLVPYHVADRGPAQVMISDYTLESLLNTSLGLNWLDFEQEMTGEAVSNYIDHFDTAFGARTKVKVIARPVKGT